MKPERKFSQEEQELKDLSLKHNEQLAANTTLRPFEKEQVNAAIVLIGSVVSPSPRATKEIARMLVEVADVMGKSPTLSSLIEAMDKEYANGGGPKVPTA